MILDNELVMMDSTAIGTTIASIAAKGTVLDFGSGDKNAVGDTIYQRPGEGGRLVWNIVCEDADFAGTTGAVVTFSLVTDSVDTLDSTQRVIATHTVTMANTTADPDDGDIIARIPIPATQAFLRYVGTMVTIATQNMSAGKATTWLGQMAETPVAPSDLKK